MRNRKNLYRRMRQRILAALLVALLVSSGVSAFAADIVPSTDAVLLQRYQTGREGFSTTEEAVNIRTAVDDAGTVCYSLTDLAQATGNDPAGWEWGFSEVYFHGSLEERRYDIPAYCMEIDGRACEYCGDGRIAVLTGRGYSVTDPGSVAFLEQDGEVYCSASGVEALFANVMVTGSEIRVLVPEKGKQIRFLRGSGLSQENKAAFTDALWKLFNDYPEGYELVMKRAGRIQLVSRSLAQAVAGERVLSYVSSDSDVIRFTKEGLARTSTEYLAGILVHECTHLEEYASTGHSSETAPTLAQTKALYALGCPMSRIYDSLVSRSETSAPGVAQALEWLATVTDGLDQ